MKEMQFIFIVLRVLHIILKTMIIIKTYFYDLTMCIWGLSGKEMVKLQKEEFDQCYIMKY